MAHKNNCYHFLSFYHSQVQFLSFSLFYHSQVRSLWLQRVERSDEAKPDPDQTLQGGQGLIFWISLQFGLGFFAWGARFDFGFLLDFFFGLVCMEGKI